MKILIGTYRADAQKVSDPQEHAAWHRAATIEAGTYPVYAYVDDRSAWTLGHSIYVPVVGKIISSYFGSGPSAMASSKAEIGTPHTVHITIPTYTIERELASGRLTLDMTLITESEHTVTDWPADKIGEKFRTYALNTAELMRRSEACDKAPWRVVDRFTHTLQGKALRCEVVDRQRWTVYRGAEVVAEASYYSYQSVSLEAMKFAAWLAASEVRT